MHKSLLLLFLLLPLFSLAQDNNVYKYWVSLSDKAGSYTLDSPSYLSPRALERRQRQGIAIDSLDLPVSDNYIQRIQQLGFRVQNRSKWLNGVVVFMTDSAQAAQLASLPFVTSYTCLDYGPASLPDIYVADSGSSREPVPFDSAYCPEYYMCGLMPIDQLHGRPLHWAGYEGQGLIIGVCDGGFPGVDTISLFDTLRSEGRLLATLDFVWDSGNIYSIHNHGTAVLSTMASYVPSIYVGTAPKASYVLCRTENILSENPLEMYNWVAAAEYLDSLGADVITTSLGYYYFDDDTINHLTLDGQSAPITIGAEVAASRGMLVVNAAGNNGDEIPPYLNAPADGEHVFAVGAVDMFGQITNFSSPGPTEDGRIKPDAMAMGAMVLTSGAGGYIHSLNGTSFSCPIMAGMMTCLWQRFPEWTPQQLCDSVRAWGSIADNPDNYYGYGIPDFSRAMNIIPAGISQQSEDASFSVYPNPANGIASVQIQTAVPATLTVSDMTGHIMQQKRIQGNALQTLRLRPGIYLISLTTAQGISTQRLVVR